MQSSENIEKQSDCEWNQMKQELSDQTKQRIADRILNIK